MRLFRRRDVAGDLRIPADDSGDMCRFGHPASERPALEGEPDSMEVMRRAVTQLFEKEGDEAAAWHAMKMRGFYFMQEEVLDNCKRAGRTLEEIVLENA